MKVGVIRNPNANKNRRGKNPADRLLKILDSTDIFIETKNTNKDLERAVEECLRNKVDAICSDGGDGTAHHTLTKLINCYNEMELPIFVPLMSGTVNFAANSFGIEGKPAEVLERVKKDQITGTAYVDALKINYNGNAMHGFVYGMGAIPNFLEKYYDKNISGFLAYDTSVRKAGGLIARGILSALFGTHFSKEIIRPVYAALSTENYHSSAHTAIVVSTMPINVLWLKPFHAVKDENNKLYLLCGDFGSDIIIKNLHNALLGRKIIGEGIYISKTNSIDIDIGDDCGMTIDGELYTVNRKDRIKLTTDYSIKIPKFK